MLRISLDETNILEISDREIAFDSRLGDKNPPKIDNGRVILNRIDSIMFHLVNLER